MAASEAAVALQSAEVKAQQKALEEKQRELEQLQANLWAKVRPWAIHCAADVARDLLSGGQ